MEIDIRTLLGKLNPECKLAMKQAAELCGRQTHFHVDIEHLLLHLVDDRSPDIALILPQFGVDAGQVASQLQQSLDRFKRGNGRTPAMSPHFAPWFQEAWLLSSMLLGEQQVRSGTLLLALLEVDSLRGLLLETAPALLEIPRKTLRDQLPALLAQSAEDAGGANRAAVGQAGQQEGAAPFKMPSLRQGGSATPSLDQFTTDITAQAREGKMDPIRGRDNEIRQIIDVLLRRRQNNPILTG